MPKGGTFANAYMLLIFNGTAIPNIADNAASSPATNYYYSLHLADPTAAGDQASHECAYTSYARVIAARSSGGFIITDATMHPAADVVFPFPTGGSETARFFGIGTASSGAGNLIYYGALSPTIAISTGMGSAPTIKAGSSIIEN